jgi:hypothetical protein
VIDLIEQLTRQKEFSLRTFGPGDSRERFAGLREHIEKELRELESAPYDLEEWIDIILLALDGAWRTGASPAEIIAMLQYKQRKNEERKWPRWQDVSFERAMEHIKD